MPVDFERLLADSFRRAHWRVRRQRPGADLRPDLIVDAGGRTYVVELKRSAEGRRDRLIPLLSQAVLEARALTGQVPGPVVPVAVVAAERVAPSVAEQVKRFGAQFAPEVGVGVMDAQGLRAFAGHGLQVLDAQPPHPIRGQQPPPQQLPRLFSDLHSWLLKTLLGQSIPESLISVPRLEFRNATQLARAAGVSVMTASRFVRQLQNEGFLSETSERLHLVRAEELLSRWVAANRQAFREIPVRWIIRGDERQLLEALKAYSSESANRSTARQPRCAIGLFAAARALGFGFVHGVPPHVYLERFDLDAIGRLGLSIENADRQTDAYIRIPANRESVFRPAVTRDGLPVSDVLQVWLDVSAHPARGQEQAEEIRRRILRPQVDKRG